MEEKLFDGIPHHEGTGEEDHRCTTDGCSGQHHQQTNTTDVCGHCGAPLDKGPFCPQCGHRVRPADDTDANTNQAKKKPIKAWIAALVAALVVIVIIVGILVVPKLFVSVEELCAQGNYEKAYEKADSAEKKDVIAENNVAVCSALCVETLKTPESFELQNAWYHAADGYVVLEADAGTSYGYSITIYFLYTYEYDEDHAWQLWDYYFDFEEEEYVYEFGSGIDYDDYEEIRVTFHNLGLSYIEATMTADNKIDRGGIKRINALFEDDLLDDVKHIEAAIP